MSLMDSLENPEVAKKKRGEKRREMWDTIKRQSPEHAEFIEQVTAKFGRPEQVIYESGGVVWDSKRLDGAGRVPGAIDIEISKNGLDNRELSE